MERISVTRTAVRKLCIYWQKHFCECSFKAFEKRDLRRSCVCACANMFISVSERDIHMFMFKSVYVYR